jgi:hypothetical protein
MRATKVSVFRCGGNTYPTLKEAIDRNISEITLWECGVCGAHFSIELWANQCCDEPELQNRLLYVQREIEGHEDQIRMYREEIENIKKSLETK